MSETQQVGSVTDRYQQAGQSGECPWYHHGQLALYGGAGLCVAGVCQMGTVKTKLERRGLTRTWAG